MAKPVRFQITVHVNKLLSFLHHSACAGPTLKGVIRFQYFTLNNKIPWTDLTFSESSYNVLFRQTQKVGCSHALAVLHPTKVGNYFMWNNILFVFNQVGLAAVVWFLSIACSVEKCWKSAFHLKIDRKRSSLALAFSARGQVFDPRSRRDKISVTEHYFLSVICRDDTR